jgi:hypothetical protein
MRNGIYRIEGSWPDTKGCGVAAVRDKVFRGIDRDYAYLGECSEKEEVPLLSLRRVQLAEPDLETSCSQPVQILGQADEEGFLFTIETDPTQIAVMESGLPKLDCTSQTAMRHPGHFRPGWNNPF